MFPGYMLEEFSCLGMLLSPLSLSMSPSLYKFTSRPVLGKSVDKTTDKASVFSIHMRQIGHLSIFHLRNL